MSADDEQMAQEDAIWPWLASDSMADQPSEEPDAYPDNEY